MRWQLKATVQLLLSCLPKGEHLNYWLQCLRGAYSATGSANRAVQITERLQTFAKYRKIEDGTVVEIGTGWSAQTALMLYFSGAKSIHTYDIVRHVRFKLMRMVIDGVSEKLDEMATAIGTPRSVMEERLSALESATDVESLFKAANITYHAPADGAATGLPEKSVDVIFTYGVLEHVPEAVLHMFAEEEKRILKPDGVAYHHVAPGDHLAHLDKRIGQVNFLKFSDWFWRIIGQNRIVYQNRLREKQYVDLFESHGAEVTVFNSRIDPRDLELLKNMKLNRRFAEFTPEELAVDLTDLLVSYRESGSEE